MRSASPEMREPSSFADRAIWATSLYRDLMGEPIAVEGPLVLWSLEGDHTSIEGLDPTDENLTTRTWSTESGPLYEAHLEARGRFPKGGAPKKRDNRPGGPKNRFKQP